MADLNSDTHHGLPPSQDFLEFMGGAPDWATLVSGRASGYLQASEPGSPYPLFWLGAEPGLYVPTAQFLQHTCLEANLGLTRYWLLRQFHENACRKNHGVFLLPDSDVDLAALAPGTQHLQVHQSTRAKGRQFNLLSGLTPAEAAKVLLAVLPSSEAGGGGDYSRESALFSLMLIFKSQQAAGEGFTLERVIQLLIEFKALLALSVKASACGYSGLSRYLASFPADPEARLSAQVGDLAGRLSGLNSQASSGQWFQPKGEALVPYLSSALTSISLGPNKPGDGLVELQRVWLEFIGILMTRRQALAAKQPFICGWPAITKHTQATLAGLLPSTKGTGNVFLFGAEAAQSSAPRFDALRLKSLVGTWLAKGAGEAWDVSLTSPSPRV